MAKRRIFFCIAGSIVAANRKRTKLAGRDRGKRWARRGRSIPTPSGEQVSVELSPGRGIEGIERGDGYSAPLKRDGDVYGLGVRRIAADNVVALDNRGHASAFVVVVAMFINAYDTAMCADKHFVTASDFRWKN